jgi:putative transposase
MYEEVNIMSINARCILDGVCYHIITRGNQRQKIFRKEGDYRGYLEKLKKYKRRHKFRLYGFCLMPNHVHLIGEIDEKENLAKFMHGINRSYTAYFNKEYKKVGHLWQGRFKSKIIVKDEYLINCINYIELNPIRANMAQSPNEYRWSSYIERNLGLASGEQILDILSL